ncbi:hypothetical protein QQP08_000062 [Theobroma cacao]|nr:hypothetical protein QQP08_000062 [Theobroma cacao]
MKLNILLVRQVRVCYFSKWNNADKHGHSHRVSHEMFLFAPLVFIHTCDFFWYEFAEGPL